MITRYSAWMDNKGLQDIDEAVFITDIKEKQPAMRVITADRALYGLRLLRAMRTSLSVVIRFAIRDRDTERRRDISRRVRNWARGGYLSISDRPGQRLRVICDKPPTLDSALKWTSEMEMTLTAYDVPWWEAVTPSRASGDGMYASPTLNVRGDVESPLDAVIRAESACNQISIVVGSQAFYFFDLPLGAGEMMTISHDAKGLLSVRKGGESLLQYRSGNSSDDLMVQPGANRIDFSATAPCAVTFTTRGRFE